MKRDEALGRLLELDIPFVRTSEAAAVLRVDEPQASRMLKALSMHGLVQRIRPGLWALRRPVDPLTLPEFLTEPFPSYVSLYSALYHRGVLSQVPQVVYVASLGRTRTFHTTVGDFSVHHLPPSCFGGFEVRPGGVKIATVEKALFDLAYLSGAKSRLFARVPELELPRLDQRELKRWLGRVQTARTRSLVSNWLARVATGGSGR